MTEALLIIFVATIAVWAGLNVFMAWVHARQGPDQSNPWSP